MHPSSSGVFDLTSPRGSSKSHVAVVSPKDAGHFGPIGMIVQALVLHGHHVVVYSTNFHFDALEPKVLAMGATCTCVQTCFDTEADFINAVKASGKSYFITFRKALLEPLRTLLSSMRPDCILADFMTVAAQEVALELKVPLVINVPGPVALVKDIIGMMDPDTIHVIGGIEIGRQRFSAFYKAVFINSRGAGELFTLLREHIGCSVVLINSWFGLEKPIPLPGNWCLTGPLLPYATSKGIVGRSHPELMSWLTATEDKPVVYVTTGSLIELKDWQVRVLFHGLKQAGVRAVWSLKEKQQEFLPSKDDPEFWIGSWLPQVQLLQSDHIVAVISHCGWGGVLETTTASKPVACLPFFFDQPGNADILVKAGIGVHITKKEVPFAQSAFYNPYDPSNLTADDVAEAVCKITQRSNEVNSYKKAALRVKDLSTAMRGSQEAARVVELACTFGIGHLLATDRYRRRSGSNIWAGALGMSLACAVLATATTYMLRSRRP